MSTVPTSSECVESWDDIRISNFRLGTVFIVLKTNMMHKRLEVLGDLDIFKFRGAFIAVDDGGHTFMQKKID